MTTDGRDADELETLRQLYAQLRVGYTVEEVTKILGPPTTAKPIYAKRDFRTPKGTVIEYQLKKQSALPNMNDIMVTIVFDATGRLIWAYPQNIPGLSEIGSRSNN